MHTFTTRIRLPSAGNRGYDEGAYYRSSCTLAPTSSSLAPGYELTLTFSQESPQARRHNQTLGWSAKTSGECAANRRRSPLRSAASSQKARISSTQGICARRAAYEPAKGMRADQSRRLAANNWKNMIAEYPYREEPSAAHRRAARAN